MLQTKLSPKEEAQLWEQVLGNINPDADDDVNPMPITPDELNIGKVAWQLAREAGMPRPRKEQFEQARKAVQEKQAALLKAKPKAARQISNSDVFPFTENEAEIPQEQTDTMLWTAKEGSIVNEHPDAYLAHHAVSSSRLKTLLKSEKHYLRYEPSARKAHLTLGTNIHLHLVPNANERYVVADVEYGYNSKDATLRGIEFFCRLTGTEIKTLEVTPESKHDALKGTLKSLIAQAEEQVSIVSAQDKTKIDKIVSEVFSNELAMELLTAQGANELSFYWQDKETGIDFKIRPDRVIKHRVWGNVLISIKSATDVEPEAFEKAYHKYGYGISDAMYLHILRAVTGEEWNAVATIAVQTTNPYLCQVYFNHAKDNVLRYGDNKFHELKAQLAECIRTNEWHGYEEVAEPQHRGAIRLNLPMWVDF